MSWTYTKKEIPKADVRATVDATNAEQYAYGHSPAHKTVLDEIAAFAEKIAAVAPDGTELAIESGGHYQDDGCGSLTLKLSVWPAPARRPE